MEAVTELGLLDGSLEVVDRGILRIVTERPTCQAALGLLDAFARRVTNRVGRVGGQFAHQATLICNALVTHAAAAAVANNNLNAHQLRERTRNIHARVTHFRTRELTIDISSDSSSSASSS